MQSRNKSAPTADERRHIARVKSMACVVCKAPGPSEAHEIEQGAWWTSLPLCTDCHRGSHNGIHGNKRMWSVHGLDEIKALNLHVRNLMAGA